ncbi:hypothetical protein EPN28_04640 [Patescibacteria group bacterium]|nr:MAG: hypothetical protein EPN28_04640 [Patescibacteria group bacterium]
MYLSWNKKTISDFADENVEKLYSEGFVFTRTGKGDMNQTRSVRIDLGKFILNSENRRILSHTKNFELDAAPLPYSDYDWRVHKMGKDFYEKKFGPKIFSAQKIKEMLTDPAKSNFNLLLIYTPPPATTPKSLVWWPAPPLKGEGNTAGSPLPLRGRTGEGVLGYCICFETKNILHYSYPFYDLESKQKDLGLGMMQKAILHAKVEGKKYVYIGSAQRPADVYKLQFNGLEWFDGKEWKRNLEELKKILKQ